MNILSETFASGIPGGFATTIIDGGGTFTVTYNAGASAVDLARSSFNGGWQIDACPPASTMRVELDLEVVNLDNLGASASGVGCGFIHSSSSGKASSLFASTESQQVSSYLGSGTNPIGFSADAQVSGLREVPTSGRQVWKFINVPYNGYRQYQLWIGGMLAGLFRVRNIPLTDTCIPVILVRDATYRLHSIDVYDDATPLNVGPALLDAGFDLTLFAPASFGPKLQLPPARLRYVDYGGFGRLQGTVKNTGSPNYPVYRRVNLHRQRDYSLIASVWSDPVTGAYEFLGIDPAEKYFVISFDDTNVFRAVIADKLPAEVWIP